MRLPGSGQERTPAQRRAWPDGAVDTIKDPRGRRGPGQGATVNTVFRSDKELSCG
ncbi:hypothetical protein GCM10010517_79470 [Streptosporangium fragile]|uniref:Uncharacterized protein n=1 Tax=Streptosporangium fragile TaxID=46186 RepID=A0ABN3WFH2_9ACTN